MKRIHNFITHISKYLRGRETPSERKELYTWYDDIKSSDTIPEEERVGIAMSAKQRIMTTIRSGAKGRKQYMSLKWISSAAAALLLVGGIYWFTLPADRQASQEELASFAPGKEQAIIILPSGETVNLDSIPLAQSIEVGNTIITKNAEGEISYESTMTAGNPTYTLQTPKSSVSEIVLSDGTKVLLNAESKLHYPAKFGNGDRIVSLEGEGYFQVSKTTHNSRFVVRSGGQEVTVLGTKFNVNAPVKEGIVWTTLEEGVVQVTSEANENNKVILRPSQQAVHKQGNLSARQVDIESILGWTRGVFYFDGTNTVDVLQQIEHWYDIDITYKENKTNVQYSGKIPRDLSLDKLIDLLSYADFSVEPRINKQNRINLIIN